MYSLHFFEQLPILTTVFAIFFEFSFFALGSFFLEFMWYREQGLGSNSGKKQKGSRPTCSSTKLLFLTLIDNTSISHLNS